MPQGPNRWMQLGKPFRLLQINLNRCRLAQDLMIRSAWEMAIDVVVISEPARQLPEWHNDGIGDASLWVTGFNGKFANVTGNISAAGIVTAEVNDTFIVSYYCSPNKRTNFPAYLDELEGIIKEIWTPGKGLIMAGDLNAKATEWGGAKIDKRGRLCMGLMARQGPDPIKLKGNFTFKRNGGRSLIDVMSVDRTMAKRHSRSTILPNHTESDHMYVLHTFRAKGTRPVEQAWTPYDVEEISVEEVVQKYKDLKQERTLGLSQVPNVQSAAETMQAMLENTAAGTLKKKRLPRGTKKPNRWWSEEISRSKSNMHSARRAFQNVEGRGLELIRFC